MVGNKARLDVLMHIAFAFPDHQDSRESPTFLVDWTELDGLKSEKHLLVVLRLEPYHHTYYINNIHIPVVPGQAGGGSFQSIKKT